MVYIIVIDKKAISRVELLVITIQESLMRKNLCGTIRLM